MIALKRRRITSHRSADISEFLFESFEFGEFVCGRLKRNAFPFQFSPTSESLFILDAFLLCFLRQLFGVVLFPDAVTGLGEMRRVVRPGGRIAVVTWTAPQHYELAAALRAAVQSVWPDQPASPLPAQLRYREATDFVALFASAGCEEVDVVTVTSSLLAPSARWLAERIGFAPGMAALVSSLGGRRNAVMTAFVGGLERRFGSGPVALSGVAFVGTARVA